MAKKNEKYIVEIIDNGYEGEGIAKINNFIVFIPGAIKGEKCKILIVKVNKNFAYGKLLEVISCANERQDVDCSTYKRCGGCELRHIKYSYTLQMKQQSVQNLVNKTLNKKIDVSETIGMENPYYYRNKLQYPVGKDEAGNAIMGVFAARTHEIIPVNDCLIQNQKIQEIAKKIIDLINLEKVSVYDEKMQTGEIRHIIVKIGVCTNQVMCILVTNEEKIKNEDKIVSALVTEFPEIKSIVKNINSKNTNVILGNKKIVLYGTDYIEDKLGEYTFKISSMSFYQTNPMQTEKLYSKAIEFAKLKQNDILYDLYCGIGTIGICASKYVKKVYGIEIVPEAIKMAKENAKINNVNNIEFVSGDVEEAFIRLIQQEKIMPNVVIIDPPRRGLDKKTINTILNLDVLRLVYVSCNPATLLRDLHELEKKYNINKIQPVDMFPFTKHIETVTLLTLKN